MRRAVLPQDIDVICKSVNGLFQMLRHVGITEVSLSETNREALWATADGTIDPDKLARLAEGLDLLWTDVVLTKEDG